MTEGWNYKINSIRESNHVLAKSFHDVIENEVDGVMQQIKQDSESFSMKADEGRQDMLEKINQRMDSFFEKLDHKADEMDSLYQKRIEELEQKTVEIVENRQKKESFSNNIRFFFSNAIMIVIALVLVRALLFGVWDGLYVHKLYDWGSQWDWLKYTMWGLFAVIIGGIGWFSYKFIKKHI